MTYTVDYLVTTDLQDIQEYVNNGFTVIMVDGTVPGWAPRQDKDYHWDHHKAGGMKIQISELPKLKPTSFLQNLNENVVIVTTQLDSDACCAAAWLQLNNKITLESANRLKAIAYDCDYLGLSLVPELQDLEDFAALAVATPKILSSKLQKARGLSPQHMTPTEKKQFYSEQFQSNTKWLMDAAQGTRKWPGQSGEADEYLNDLKVTANMLYTGGDITFYQDAAICDLREAVGYIDPRSVLMAIELEANERGIDPRPETLTIRKHRKEEGVQYTLGSIPSHPDAPTLDYCRQQAWKKLTIAEALQRDLDGYKAQTLFGKTDFSAQMGFDPWGGRASVGGSGWNTASQLHVKHVIDIILS